MEGGLTFRLLTPRKEVAACACDAVNLWEREGKEGRNGGSIGIRRGHLPAVIALAEDGPLRVSLEGKTVFSARVRGGFARVEPGAVTVLTPAAEVTTGA